MALPRSIGIARGLGWLATLSNSEAVLPAYMVGLALAGIFAHQRDTLRRLRTTVFAFLTPFYFLNAGMKVNATVVGASLGLIVILLAVKLFTKAIGVWPLTQLFRFGFRESAYTTLLMSTGLTFGTISALFGLTHGYTDRAGTFHTYINQEQYSILVTVVIGSAIVTVSTFAVAMAVMYVVHLMGYLRVNEDGERSRKRWGLSARGEAPQK